MRNKTDLLQTPEKNGLKQVSKESTELANKIRDQSSLEKTLTREVTGSTRTKTLQVCRSTKQRKILGFMIGHGCF